jgi:hypothetical protein
VHQQRAEPGIATGHARHDARAPRGRFEQRRLEPGLVGEHPGDELGRLSLADRVAEGPVRRVDAHERGAQVGNAVRRIDHMHDHPG